MNVFIEGLSPSARLAAKLIVMVAAIARMGGAQQTAPTVGDSLPLTLEQAIDRATSQSQEVRLARSQVSLAEAQVRATKSGLFPQLSAQLNYVRTFESPFSIDPGPARVIPDSERFEPDPTRSTEERIRYLEQRAPFAPNAVAGDAGSFLANLPFGRPNAYTATLNGTQAVYGGGRLGAGLRIASQYLQAARLDLREQSAQIELDVRSAYYRARLARELAIISQEAVEQAARFLNVEKLRRDAGTGSELDVLRAEVALANLQPSLTDATNAAEVATLDLKRLIDVPLAQPVALVTSLDVSTILTTSDSAVASTELLAHRASIEAEERQVRIREEQVRVARSGYLPSINLNAAYGKQLLPATVFGFNEPWRTDFTAGVSVSVPLFNGNRTRAEVAQAQVQLEQGRLRLGQLRENVQLEYERARGERERSRVSIQARQSTVQQAQRVYDLTVLRYEQGLASQLEVSDARLSLLQSRTNLAQAVADFQIANARVSRALGVPMVR